MRSHAQIPGGHSAYDSQERKTFNMLPASGRQNGLWGPILESGVCSTLEITEAVQVRGDQWLIYKCNGMVSGKVSFCVVRDDFKF